MRAQLMYAVLAASLVATAACGDDDAPPPKPAGTATAPPPAGTPGGPAANGPKLVPQVHVEQVVVCKVHTPDPQDKDEKTCDPKAAVSGCAEHRFCLEVQPTKFFCEKCPERETIRHVFSERDFVSDPQQNRDPFHSYLVPDTLADKNGDKSVKPVGKCTEKQMKIPGYSYADLKLIGIVSQGTNRKVLLMAGNKGEIIHRGECVGKEKAYVKEIGATYITFQLQDQGKGREPEERSIQLYPNALQLGDYDSQTQQPPPTTAPIEAPPTDRSGLPPGTTDSRQQPQRLPQQPQIPAVPPPSGSNQGQTTITPRPQ